MSIFAKNNEGYCNLISTYTSEKINEFLTRRIELKSFEHSIAVKEIESMQNESLKNLSQNAIDYEQEEIILKSLYYMEIYEHSMTKANRKDMREQMRQLMEASFKCIDSRSKDKISKWLYSVSGDVTSYYMTRSISATFYYGLKVKGFYEEAIKIDSLMPSANISLGNWFFYAPFPFGSNKKAEKCYKNGIKGAIRNDIDGEKYLLYEFISQLYFEQKKYNLCNEYFQKAIDLNLGTRELDLVDSCNKKGYSFYQYNRNKAGIDEELPEDEKDDADRKETKIKN